VVDDERSVLLGRDGRVLLTYLAGTDDGRPAAFDALPGPGADPDEVADAVTRRLTGHVVGATEDLGDRLAARGARVRRRFRRMRRPLDTDPPPPDWAAADLGAGRRVVPVDAGLDPRAVLPAWFAAYSRPGHPDAYAGTAEEAFAERLVPLLDGTEGPILPWSRLVVDGDGRVLAGVLGIDVPPQGDTIGEVFRDPAPDAAGLGAALLRRVAAVAAGDGVPALHLAVTDGNPAAHVYERLGFRSTGRYVTVVTNQP
jgi:GNAT superfamily N-acetyltransferase